jgi:hypothetical protein
MDRNLANTRRALGSFGIFRFFIRTLFSRDKDTSTEERERFVAAAGVSSFALVVTGRQ